MKEKITVKKVTVKGRRKILLQEVLEIIESQFYTQEQIEAEPILSMQDEMIHENRGVYKVLTSILKI